MLRMRDRLEKSWVVEGPITVMQHTVNDSVRDRLETDYTNFIARSAHKARRGLQTPSIALGALLRNIIARAELDIRLFEIVSHSAYENQ